MSWILRLELRWNRSGRLPGQQQQREPDPWRTGVVALASAGVVVVTGLVLWHRHVRNGTNHTPVCNNNNNEKRGSSEELNRTNQEEKKTKEEHEQAPKDGPRGLLATTTNRPSPRFRLVRFLSMPSTVAALDPHRPPHDKHHQQPQHMVTRSTSSNAWDTYQDDDEIFIQRLPKVELHVHFDGSFDPHLLWQHVQQLSPKQQEALFPEQVPLPWAQKPSKEEEKDIESDDSSCDQKTATQLPTLPLRSMIRACQDVKDFHALCTCRGGHQASLEAMLNTFEVFLPIVRGNLELLEQAAFDFCRRCYEQHVVYAEVRYSPHLLAYTLQPPSSSSSENASSTPVVDASDVLAAVTAGLRRGCWKFQSSALIINQILCAITWRPDWAQPTLDLVVQHRLDFPCATVGIDIAAGEEHFDAHRHPDLYQPHYEMIQRAKSLRIPITLHAGETQQPHPDQVSQADHVRRAILDYGARRIGHGYRMIDDPEVMELVRRRGIHVEVCPTSSVETGGWQPSPPSSSENPDDPSTCPPGRNWPEHPAVAMCRQGLSVGLNSDDPAVFHTSLAWQHRIALAKMRLTRRDLIRMNRQALEASFASEQEKQRVQEALDAFEQSLQVDGDHQPIVSGWHRAASDTFVDRVYLTPHEYS